MRLVPVAAALALAASSLHAQDTTLRVLRHTPGDTASPGNIVTVMFDRPVAGALDRTVEASRIVRIEPAIAGRAAWRDPITIRFIPDAPMQPGASFTVTVDTTFRALDGSRLAQPYQFSFRVPGPRLLARSRGGDFSSSPDTLPWNGTLQLLYSAPVDLDRLSHGMRLEIAACHGQRARQVPLRPVRQRAVRADDPYWIQYAGGWDRDTTAERFRRVVEVEPASALPPDCPGLLVIPTTSADARYGHAERFAVRTAPRFQLRAFDCSRKAACPLDGLAIEFTAPVKQSDLLRHVRLEPAHSFVLPPYREQASRWTLAVHLAPRSTYTVIVDDSLRDVHGRLVSGPHRAQVVTGDYVPAISFAHGMVTIPWTGAHTIPIRHVNVSAIRIVSYAVPNSMRTRVMVIPPPYFDQMVPRLSGLRPETTTVQLKGTFNVESTTELPLSRIMTPAPGALAVLRMEIASERVGPAPDAVRPPVPAKRENHARWFPPTYVQLSDLAVHGKRAPGQEMVFVTRLEDARPQIGATVRELDADGRVIAEGTTGADGVAMLHRRPSAADDQRRVRTPIVRGWPPRSGLIEAVMGDDRVAMPLAIRMAIAYPNASALQAWRLGGRAEFVPSATAAIFTDRGIYRPGEMLYVGGVIRRGVLGALELPAAHDSARVTITYKPNEWYSDEDVVVRDTVLRLTTLGTLTDSLRLRAGVPLGPYEIAMQVMRDTSWDEVATEHVRVGEYRAPEFLVHARADSTPLYGGDTAHVLAAATYLFGAPMAHARVQWSAILREVRPWELHIPGAEGWTVGEWEWWTERDDSDTMPRRFGRMDELDSTGHLDIRVPIAGLRPSRPGRVEVHVAVMDVNQQVVTASTSVPVHPAHLYVLARQGSQGWMWTAHRRATIEIRTVRPDGSELPDIPVVVRVARLRWVAPPGDGYYGGHWTEDTVRTDTVRTGERAGPYSILPSAGGIYIVRLSANDAHGGVARTTLTAYAAGGGGSWWSQSPYHLPLVTEQRELAVGEEARIAFDSPFDEAEAWVTVEREHVLEQRHLTVHRGPNIVPLRITEQHVPNVFVSVFLLRSVHGTAPRPDSASQLLRVGYAELRVTTVSKRLTVAVDPEHPEYRPGDTAVVRVRVRDAFGHGARSEVTVWAVDQGVLALTGFQTPDVLARLYAPRGLGAQLWSSVPTMLTANPAFAAEVQLSASMMLQEAVVTSSGFGMASDSIASGEGGLSNAPLRVRFRSTAFYIASVPTDDEGNATVRAHLPDNLTTYRVMAIAVSRDAFGSGDSTLLATRALVARPALPRFVRASDSLVAGAVVNARDGRARPVRVGASSDGIAIMGTARRDILLAKGKGAEAQFSFAVPSRDRARDTVLVRFSATDGTNGDRVEARLPVRPDFSPRAHTTLGAVRGSADVTIRLPGNIDPARSELSIRLGTSPLAPMLAAYEWLRAYPYDCTEQITSVGRALLAVWRATRERNPRALGGDPRPRLQALVDELTRRQRADGGIRYWGDDDWTSPWLSAYAGLFLLDARDAGIVVSPTTITHLTEYMRATTTSPIDTGGMNRTERESRRLALGDRVAAVEFLRRSGNPDAGEENALLRLAPVMTWEDRLRLAEALASRRDVRDRARAIVDAAWRAVTPAGNRVDLPDSAYTPREFPSRVAPAARLLTASLALRSTHPWIGGLIETVLQQGRAEGGWTWSTQDYASVVLALSAFADSNDSAREVRVMSGKQLVLSRRIRDSDSPATVPLTGLLERTSGGVQLHLHLTSTGEQQPVYFAVTVNEVPSTPPVTPDDQGIVVERWYERFDDGRPVTSVRAGDLVRVRLRVTVPADRQFVAVVDPFPAGLEPVDLSLHTSATLQPFVTPESQEARLAGDRDRDGPRWQAWLYGRWDNGWWSPWEHKALYDDRVVYFARVLWKGSYTASYIARATTSGSFVRPPAHAEEMYNPALQGRSDGGRFGVEAGAPE